MNGSVVIVSRSDPSSLWGAAAFLGLVVAACEENPGGPTGPSAAAAFAPVVGALSYGGHGIRPVPEGVFGGAFDSDVKVDFKWRVVNATQAVDLRTACVVLTGK
jgi:hypothetical protein